MKRLLLAVVALVAFTISASAVAIIPQPQSVVKHDKNFTISTSTTFVYGAKELKPIADYTLEYLKV
ncbi:MAG: hypothetical protein IKU93_03855, partial [Alistipes sp.]|nr:hypothetical protein [Alistipes sp.]